MIDSTGGIQDEANGGGYLARAVLDASALDSIREINAEFLTLLAQQHAAAPGTAPFGLRTDAVAGVAALDARGLRAAAGCPYTLFNLRFEDAGFWAGLASGNGRGAAADAGAAAAFARTAVFLAWHLALNSELTAALAFGMTGPVQQAWRRLRLSALDRAATEALPHLRARWGGHPSFWPKLVEAAAPPDRARASAVRLLGLQLLAADGIRADAAVAEARPGR